MTIYNSKTLIHLLVLFFILSILYGCDPNAKEKRILRSEIAQLETDISLELEKKQQYDLRVQSIREEIQYEHSKNRQLLNNINDYQEKITSLKSRVVLYKVKKAKIQYDMGKYIMNHKMATLSIIATGGGLAATLEENMDEDTKRILQGAGIVGAIYCIFNFKECTRVTTRLYEYDSDITDINSELSSAESQTYDYKRAIEPLNDQYSRYQTKVNSLNAKLKREEENDNSMVLTKLREELRNKKEKYDSL